MYTAAIVCMSDSGAEGTREDKSTGVIEKILVNNGFDVIEKILLPDEYSQIIANLKNLSDEIKVNLVITTGGTGLTERDTTPEATLEVIVKEVPGIAEAIRAFSMKITKRAMLSRGVAGVREKTLIINLPGSPKACEESLNYIIEEVKHGLDLMLNGSQNCARK